MHALAACKRQLFCTAACIFIGSHGGLAMWHAQFYDERHSGHLSSSRSGFSSTDISSSPGDRISRTAEQRTPIV
jgi:hypothetical protein